MVARRSASTDIRCLARTFGSIHAREREPAEHAFGRTNGATGLQRATAGQAIQACRSLQGDPVVLKVAFVLTSSGCSTTPYWADPTRSWEPAGCSPVQPIRMGALTDGRSGTRTGWAGSCYAAQSLTAWSCITAAGSPPAGIRTILSSLPMRKTWPLLSRHIASMGIRCRVPISGSTRARARGSAGRAARKASERSGSAKPQPSSCHTRMRAWSLPCVADKIRYVN